MGYVCIKQHDSKDCGAACLAIICRNYNLELPLVRYIELVKTDIHGTNIYGIVDAASKLGMEAVALNGNWDELMEGIHNKEIKFPFIAQIFTGDMREHYVVIHEMKKNSLVVADPAFGIKKISYETFRSIWIGNLITFALTEKFQKRKERNNTMTSFFGIIKEHKKTTAFIIVCSVVISLVSVLGALTFQYMVDLIASGGRGSDAKGILNSINSYIWNYFSENTLQKVLAGITISVIMLYLLEAFLRIVRGYLLSYVSKKLDIGILLKYFNHVALLPMNTLQAIKTGEVLSRFSDAASIREAITKVMFSATMDTLMVIFGGFILSRISIKLFFWILVLSLCYGIIILFFKNPIKKVEQNTMEGNAIVTSYIKEAMDGIETVKLFHNENNVKNQVQQKVNNMIENIFKGNILNNNKNAFVSFTTSVGMVVLFWLGLLEVLDGKMSIGALISFQSLSMYFLNPFSNLVGLQSEIQTAVVASERLGDMMLIGMEDLESGRHIQSLKKDIHLKDISFRYGNRQLVLDNINVSIKYGQKIGIVGESGSGKTSLSKMLMALYSPEKGDIFFGSTNISDISKAFLRSKIAYLQQDLFFFSDTIRNNLKIANENITDEELEQICKKCLVHEFIQTLPYQYDTVLEEGGSNLSGGQKQMLAFARALLKQPDIVILDEVTSNLDSITEKNIEQVINCLRQEGITCILIAHRLKTVKDCDQIYVMDQGRIIEEGNHEELISIKGKYYSLWENL